MTRTSSLRGANVVAIHIPTGTTYGAVTNQDGRFNMVNMRVGGPYTVSISYIGFNHKILKMYFDAW